MEIKEFISNFRNHPVLFIGTGMSLRYLENSFTWDGLLKYICNEFSENDEHYLDIKSRHYENNTYLYDSIATDIEQEFNAFLQTPEQRNGKFKDINDYFYAQMANNINISRFKIYISKLFNQLKFKDSVSNEISSLKRARKNISSIITTNYDQMIETLFDFKPLIGNDILLSNPYGSVYKIHGCVSEPQKIIITSEDYDLFNRKYELIRAQLLSLFIHNPIIFIGYNIGDSNIKDILKTIFTYVDPNTPEAEKIRSNFLLIEYEKGSGNMNVTEHDIVLEDIATIRINKIKTDDFISIYEAIGDLQLPVSAMDVRKVQNIVKEIYAGGDIKVSITEDLDKIDNKDKVLVIGSRNTITYDYQTTKEMMVNYFTIIEENNAQLIKLINKQRIQSNQYFPIFAFSSITSDIAEASTLKKQQYNKLKDYRSAQYKNSHKSLESIENDDKIAKTNKINMVIYALLHGNIGFGEIESYLREYPDKHSTDYRKLLCAYDYVKYGGNYQPEE